MQLDPTATTVGDICTAALRESMAIGQGQVPSGDDVTDTWARLQWMLQQWNYKRWLIFHLVTYTKLSTGSETYTVGPGGDFDTNATPDPFNFQFNQQFGAGPGFSLRPDRIESAYLTQLVQPGVIQPGGAAILEVDYPLEILKSKEDYNQIRIKKLMSFPEIAFYDTAYPFGILYAWPIPQANIYAVNITVREQLPYRFTTLAQKFVLPEPYYAAMLYNLALRLRPKYGLRTYPGDMLPALARDSLNVLRTGQAQIARLRMPANLRRQGIYNIFSDRSY